MTRALGLRPRADTTYVGQGTALLATDLHGVPRRSHHGLWVDETRMLSRYEWRVEGAAPIPAGAAIIDHRTWLGYFIATPPNAETDDAAQETLELRLTRTVGSAFLERVDVTNHTQRHARVRLSLELEADFADLNEAGSPRRQHGRTTQSWTEVEEGRASLCLRYEAEHSYDHQGNRGVAHIERSIGLTLDCPGCAPHLDDGRIEIAVALPPHATYRASLTWIPRVESSLPILGNGHAGTRPPAAGAVEVTDGADPLGHVVIQAVQRAQEDIAALRLADAQGHATSVLAGGWPTYTAFFGRDSLAASWQAAILSSDLMQGALTALAATQGGTTNDWLDEQPGRMLHEHHRGPLAALRFGPHERYYGDVTSSFYYPVVVGALWHWTGELDRVRPFVRPALDALAWADGCARREDGFYVYRTRSEQGEKNQGWKDSGDAIVHADGTQVSDPLGTCEMQAFVYAAKMAMSEVLFWLGEVRQARALFSEAQTLKRRFNESFWMDEERYIAMAVGPDGRLVRSVASDPGHCIAAGIVDSERVAEVAARLMRPDLFSGWGIRTLSALHPAYDPFAYHRGTVWPVENAVFALGFARYGLHAEMHTLCKAQFEAARLFEAFRLPETFAGHPRDPEHPFPGLYPKADWPQAWSASAVLAMLQAMLGIVAYAPLHALLIDPHLPEWLPSVTLNNLRVGAARVDLRFLRRPNGRTDYEVLSRDGTVHVLRQPSPQSLTAGWAERVRDAVGSLLPQTAATAL